MHMADALISPAVGGTFWVLSGYLAAASSRRLKEAEEDRSALMGVLAAFVFAAQMINFTIPGTGSSGHVGGGLLLAIFLGPERAFLSMVSILAVQAFFFADGGLLALGCNIFNLGFFPCFIAYPYIYKKITEKYHGKNGVFWGSVTAALVGLELGALFVVAETVASGITSIPTGLFAMLMMPVHLAIGAVEGVATALIVTYVYANAPEIMERTRHTSVKGPLRRVVLCFAALTILTGGIFAWYASAYPDGLEWSIAKATGQEELTAPNTVLHRISSKIQERIAPLPDYALPDARNADENIGTSLSGMVGAALTLLIAGIIGVFIRRKEGAPSK